MPTLWNNTIHDAERMRRQLHQHPELAWQEFSTATTIRNRLDQLNIPWHACAETGTIAVLNAQANGKHVALRGDIDALPIVERTGKSWTSQTEGCMHACGHDGHTATLLATAAWLKHHEASLSGPVTLLFQPAEEGGHGAQKMIEDGALEGIDEIFGWHNWPAIAFGKLACPEGVVMCGNGTFKLTVLGQGGHASQPELCKDPVLTASAIVMALQQICSRRLAPQQAAVVSVTSIDAKSFSTIIPDQAIIEGSIRVPNELVRKVINELITDISQQTAASYGLRCEVDIQMRYGATINHAAQAERVRSAWQTLHGEELGDKVTQVDNAMPIMASEDFSYYLNEIPGAFALIGSDDGPDHSVPCHNATYDFNDRLIPMVTSLYAHLVGAPGKE